MINSSLTSDLTLARRFIVNSRVFIAQLEGDVKREDILQDRAWLYRERGRVYHGGEGVRDFRGKLRVACRWFVGFLPRKPSFRLFPW